MQEYIPFFQGENRSFTEKLAKYFEYSGLESKIDYDEANDVYILSVPADKEKEAKKHYQAFYFVERERIKKAENEKSSEISEEAKQEPSEKSSQDISEDMVISENELEEETESELVSHKAGQTPTDDEEDMTSEVETEDYKGLITGSGNYMFKSEKYQDYTGTFYIFLFLGIAGVIFVILNIARVLTILNGVFPNFIMGALFLFFIYEAITIWNKAKKLKWEIEEENQLTEKINQWLQKTVTKDFLASISNDNLSEELNYMKQTDTIRDMLLAEFGEQNHDYLDRLIEEYYNQVFDL
ncbi:hypothetical protein [Herbinix luporum]|uniref:Uncharacterized protein n=1 Tax=Herbinix luporum TaxID=1679721 RepID=A0A0K8J499_9FIRM|nr:hypothetical protein [Herbinix luporum]CUH92491.1 hypothetical protein SD1D_0944 [Herbinix luporum]